MCQNFTRVIDKPILRCYNIVKCKICLFFAHVK